MIGTTIADKYAIVREIGAGGMGAVYEARHTGTGRRVAVKVITGELTMNEQLRARFELEARAAGAIESEHIAQVLDVGYDPMSGAPFLVMELLVGEELAHAIERIGPLPPDVVLRIGVQACLGLAKAHAQGIIHRDIKPANIFLNQRDSGELCVKILDFGIAKVAARASLPEPSKPALTRVGAFLGSPRYMSPEQTLGSATLDARTDLWSLGIVLYEALTGGTPFDHLGTVTEFVAAVNTRPIAPIRERAPWVDPAIARAVERALAIIPGERYQSAAEMRAALEVFLPNGAAIRGNMLVSGRGGASYVPSIADQAGPPAGTRIERPMPIGNAATVASTPQGAAMWQGTVPGQPAPVTQPSPGIPLYPPGAQIPSAPGIQSVPGIVGPMPPPPARPAQGAATGKILVAVGVGLTFAAIGSVIVAVGVLRSSSPEPEGSASAAAPSASAPRETATATPELLSIVGSWKGGGGLSYDAVQNGQAVELRISDADPLAAQGYVEGDTHFTLRTLVGETNAFRVIARIRPLPPKGTVYDKGRARTTCENTWREVAGKPLRAELEEGRLRVTLVRAEPPASSFVREGNRVVRCVDLAKAPVTETELVLTRGGATPTTPTRPSTGTPAPPRDAGAPHTHDAGAPVVFDAGAPALPAFDGGNPFLPTDPGGGFDPGAGPRANGMPCQRDGQCISQFCAARRCANNDLGMRCVSGAQCSSRHCIGGRCGR